MNQGADINSVFLGNIFLAGERFVLWASKLYLTCKKDPQVSHNRIKLQIFHTTVHVVGGIPQLILALLRVLITQQLVQFRPCNVLRRIPDSNQSL